MEVNKIEVQVIHTSNMEHDNSFAVRVLVNNKETSVLELEKLQILHIGAILLNASNKFINNYCKDE